LAEAHRLLYHSTLGLRVIKKKKNLAEGQDRVAWQRLDLLVDLCEERLTPLLRVVQVYDRRREPVAPCQFSI